MVIETSVMITTTTTLSTRIGFIYISSRILLLENTTRYTTVVRMHMIKYKYILYIFVYKVTNLIEEIWENHFFILKRFYLDNYIDIWMYQSPIHHYRFLLLSFVLCFFIFLMNQLCDLLNQLVILIVIEG